VCVCEFILISYSHGLYSKIFIAVCRGDYLISGYHNHGLGVDNILIRYLEHCRVIEIVVGSVCVSVCVCVCL